MAIYLDHNACSPLRRVARDAMLAVLAAERGNPSSAHQLGHRARVLLEEARVQVAEALGVVPSEIVFTSGGTESNAAAIFGVAWARGQKTVCTTPIEHSSVLGPVKWLKRQGYVVRFLQLDSAGRICLEHLRKTLAEGDVALVTVGWANNETGVCQPMGEVAEVCREFDVPLHSDAVQALGRIPVVGSAVDLLSASAHKFGGPAGVGFLVVRSDLKLCPLLYGGGQERGLRPGTENVPGIVGCAVALQQAVAEVPEVQQKCARLRERLWQGLADLPGVVRYSQPTSDFLPNTLCVGFEGIAGDALVARLDLEGVCASVGSACASGAVEPSHVLLALGVPQKAARSAVRFSLGLENTAAEVDTAAEIVRRIVSEFHAGGVRGHQWAVG